MKIDARRRLTTDNISSSVQSSAPSQNPEIPVAAAVELPLSSGADLARRSAPLADQPVTTPLRARLAALAGAGSQAGLVAMAQRLDEIAQLVAAGQTVRCVFDLDNTLFDTRFRTLHAAQEFDRINRTHWFAGLSAATIDRVGIDGRATAEAAGLPPAVVDAVAGFWSRSFWTPANLAYDQPIESSLELVRAAQQAGARVVFLTGRAESCRDPASGGATGFRADTIAQLQRAGIDLAECDLLLKPQPQDSTPHFKEALLRGWQDQGALGFFVTEGQVDTAHIAARLPDAHCFLLGCTLERGHAVVPTSVPRLPAVF